MTHTYITHYISTAAIADRGWGFPAVRCREEEAVVHADGVPLKPIDPDPYESWVIAGSPSDDESLEFYGATKPSRTRH